MVSVASEFTGKPPRTANNTINSGAVHVKTAGHCSGVSQTFAFGLPMKVSLQPWSPCLEGIRAA